MDLGVAAMTPSCIQQRRLVNREFETNLGHGRKLGDGDGNGMADDSRNAAPSVLLAPRPLIRFSFVISTQG